MLSMYEPSTGVCTTIIRVRIRTVGDGFCYRKSENIMAWCQDEVIFVIACAQHEPVLDRGTVTVTGRAVGTKETKDKIKMGRDAS